MNKLLIATSNPAKLREFKEFLSDLPLKLVSLEELGISEKSPETGDSFNENAVMKANFYGNLSQLPTLADDGGFEVDALNGLPGVKSHRWIHQDREDTDEEIITYALEKMKNIPVSQRGAQLRLVLAFRLLNGKIYIAEEKVKGVVADKPYPDRTPGFPFRALLMLPEINKYYEEKELTLSESEKYNHRKRAIGKLKPIIRKFMVES